MDEIIMSKNELPWPRREKVGQMLRFGLNSLIARPQTDKEQRITFQTQLTPMINAINNCWNLLSDY